VDTSREQAELLARIIVIEKQLTENEKIQDKVNDQFSHIAKQLDAIKDDIRHQKDIPTIQVKLDNIERDMTDLKINITEMVPIKKMFFGLVGFILLAFFTLIWNSLVLNKPTVDMNDITKKIISEYNKTEKK
jgi:hypothetical protein